MKPSYLIQVDIIINKLKKLNASATTIKAFQKEFTKIADKGYKVLQHFKEYKDLISADNNTLVKVKEQMATIKRDKKAVQKNKRQEKIIKSNKFIESAKITWNEKDKATLNKVVSKLNNYNIKVRQLAAEYKGKSGIVAIRVNGKMNKNEIKNLSNSISKVMSKNKVNGSIGVTIRYSDYWSESKFVDYGKNVILADAYDEEENEFQNFEIYLTNMPLKIAGNSSQNDCLFSCLQFYLTSNLPWNSDAEFKKFLKVPNLSKVQMRLIPTIENKIKIPINVRGDYTYKSVLKSETMEINLLLNNEHVIVDTQKSNNKANRQLVSFIERKPIIYNKRTYMGFDGKTERLITKEERNLIYDWKTEYILIDSDLSSEDTLEQQYKQFVEDAKILKNSSNGLINLFKTGNIKTTALDLFDRLSKHIIKPDSIDQIESQWIKLANKGAIISAEKGFNGSAHSYDINSMYPSILKSKMLYPVKSGEFLKLSDEEFENKDYYQYGIYRCMIIPNNLNNKLFRINEEKYYTHFDLTRAKELKYKIKLIQDTQPNFLYYSRDKCLVGSQVFGPFVDLLYKMKKDKILKSNRVKQILNTLWGGLTEKRTKKYIEESNSKIILPDDSSIYSIKPYGEHSACIKMIKNNKYFINTFARIGPFILSKGREIISRMIEPFHEDVVYIHTDGFKTRTQQTNLIIGCDIGQLKYEGLFRVINPIILNILNIFNT